MKILAAGDLHGDTRAAENLAKLAEKEKVDLVILSGDLTYAEQSTDNLIGPFKKHHQKVLLVPGNHETVATADFLSELYNVKNLHGYSVKYQDIGIFGCGGANVGLNQIPEKDIYDFLEKGFKKIEYLKKKIMVTHNHPSGTTMEKLSDFVPGSTGVENAIKKFKPDLVLCSHVHEAEGLEEKIGKTKVINVGKKGKIINL